MISSNYFRASYHVYYLNDFSARSVHQPKFKLYGKTAYGMNAKRKIHEYKYIYIYIAFYV